MKNSTLRLSTLSLAALCALLLSACVSPSTNGTAPTPVVKQSTADFAASLIQPIAQGAVPLVLNRNPGYAGAVAIVADAIPVILGSGTLTPDSIAAAISALDRKAALGLEPDIQALLANALAIAVSQYQQQFGVKVAVSTDPGVQTILLSFSAGLRDGLTVWKASHP